MVAKMFPCTYVSHVTFEGNSFIGFHGELKSQSICSGGGGGGGGGSRPVTMNDLLTRIMLHLLISAAHRKITYCVMPVLQFEIWIVICYN